MKTKTKYLIASFLFLLLLMPALSHAVWSDPSSGCQETGLSCNSVIDVLMTLMQFLLVILTILGVISFIISGIIYVTAGGAGKADLARHWLTYSIIGMVVALSGYIIINTIANILSARLPL